MFDGIEEKREGWRLVHQKYVTSRIIQKNHSIEKTTALTLLSPMMFYWFDKIIN